MAVASTNTVAQRRPIDCSISVLSGIDHCSSDSTVIVTIDCGPLLTSDSVLLYDITLNYPMSKLSFRQVLYQNTLSENLDSRGYRILDSGAIRVYGFNITRFLSGSKPLVALMFKHKANCTDSIPFEFAFLPEFNPESKVYVREMRSALVPIASAYDKKRSLTFQFSNDTIVLPSNQTSFTVPLKFQLNGTTRTSAISVTLEISPYVTFDWIKPSDDIDFRRSDSGSSSTIKITGVNGRTLPLVDSLVLCLSHYGTSVTDPEFVRIQKISWDTCSCLSLGVGDSLRVKKQDISQVGDDEHKVNIASDGDVWDIENRTDGPARVEVVNVHGQVVWSVDLGLGEKNRSLSNWLPSGIYLARISTANSRFYKKLKVWK